MFGAFGALHGIKALNKNSGQYPWLKNMEKQMNALFNNRAFMGTNALSKHLQLKAKRKMRNKVSKQIADKLITMATSGESQVSAREWFLRLLEQYAPLKIMFTHISDYNDQEEIDGVFEHFDTVLPVSFRHYLDDERTTDEILNEMHAKMMRLEFDLAFAKYTVEILSDKDLSLVGTDDVIKSALLAKRSEIGKVVSLYQDDNKDLNAIFNTNKTLFLDSRNKNIAA